SLHWAGERARAGIDRARRQIATLLQCGPGEVVLTSGGTEANNLGVRSAMEKRAGALVTSRLEHASVVKVAEAFEREGREVHWAKADARGAVEVTALAKYVQNTPNIAAFAIQAVNHETGIIQPIREIAELARARDAWLHVDAVQGFGRIDDVAPMATTRSISAHKIRGPKGVGALITQPDVKIEPVIRGGAQERGIRPGTVDPIAIAGFGVAAAHAKTSAIAYASLAPLRDALESALVGFGGEVNGGAPRAPHVTNISFSKWFGEELVAALDLEGVSISSGAACSAGTIEPSPVLAVFVSDDRAKSAVRMSLGLTTTHDEITRAIEAFRRVLSRL
ncbi:MAG: cysteine desulfurase family protein, partial [Polyangiaceae bacterium]